MKAIDYQNKKNRGEWVPEKGDIVAYHPIIGGPAESNGHTVKSVFPAACGTMVAFISGKRAHVSTDALSEASSMTGPMKENNMLMDENTTISFEGFKKKKMSLELLYEHIDNFEKSSLHDHSAIKIFPCGYLETTDEPFCIGILVTKKSMVERIFTVLHELLSGFEAHVVSNETRKITIFENGRIVETFQPRPRRWPIKAIPNEE